MNDSLASVGPLEFFLVDIIVESLDDQIDIRVIANGVWRDYVFLLAFLLFVILILLLRTLHKVLVSAASITHHKLLIVFFI